jgi:F-type H+-transporting ATPase subunit a
LKKFIISGLIFSFFLTFAVYPLAAQEGHEATSHETENEEFNASEFIIEHVTDSHEWHILTKANGESVALYLPVILYSKEKGLDVFSSRLLAHGHVHDGYMLMEEGDLSGKIVFVNEAGVINEEKLPLDLSITKTVVGMLFAAIVGLILFLSLARSYKKTGISAPKGIQGFLEPLVLFIRDDVARPNIGEHKYEKYMPYLLSVFFFILINNVFGLIPTPPPFGANVTGNIAMTGVLALCTFIITQFSGNKSHWKHVFATPGVPWWLLPIMIPVELIGLFTKPFALMIRLFANIAAGHIIVLSLISLIFIMQTFVIAPVSVMFVIFMDCVELLVAFIQAYIFTLLSSLFIGMAMPEEHH